MSFRVPHNITAIIAATIMLAACSTDIGQEGGCIDMPIRITIPVEGTATRAIGDPPGTDVPLHLPTHAYIFWVTYLSDGKMACTYRHLPLTEGWTRSDAQSADGSAVYAYNGEVSLRKDVDVKVARIYVALSNAPISPDVSRIASEDDVQGVTFDIPDDYFEGTAANDGLDDFLKHLYSTPATLQSGGQYYGTIPDITSKVPHIDIVCYHVAAKLDITWNVAEDAQPTKRITSIQATGLYRKRCSLFNPAVNSTVNTADTYTQPLATINAGNQWYGRASIYAIQHRGSAGSQTFSFTVGVDDSSRTPSATTVCGTTEVDYANTGTTFTPWMRGIININQDSTQ